MSQRGLARLNAQLQAVTAQLVVARVRVDELETQQDELQRLVDGYDLEDDEGASDAEDAGADVDADGDAADADADAAAAEVAQGEPCGGPLPRALSADEGAHIPLPPLLDDEQEDQGGTLREETEEDRACEAALTAELGVDFGVNWAWVSRQLEPVQQCICFNARAYTRELVAAVLRSRVRNDRTPFVTPDQAEQFVCGGATQAGKTMFVVVGIVAAYKAELPAVVRARRQSKF
jgi:hypothetical protein